MVQSYDLVIIGTGTAAAAVARRCAAAGRRVAIVDQGPFGGTCALRGCDPKKVLVGVAAAADRERRLRGKGLAGDGAIDWHALMAFKRSFTDPVPDERARGFAQSGIDAYRGQAQFAGPQTIAVAGCSDALEGQSILIAAGAVPRKLGIPGEAELATSTDFLELDVLPRRVVFVGGGYIAAELSHVAARAGAAVTILQRSDRLLPQFDPELVGRLTEKSKRCGIDVRCNAQVRSIERTNAGLRVAFDVNGASSTLEADLVVHAAGRVPDLEPLDLGAGGVAVENERLLLNEFLQSTTNAAVYAAGDAAHSGPPLTPVASHDAEVVATNLLEGNRARPDYRSVPSVVFTIPPLARVGLLEDEARQRHLRFRVQKALDTAGWYTARRVNEDCAGFKVLVEEDSDRVLGAHVVGPEADEVINLFALAVRHGLTTSQLKATIFGYPTAGSDISSMV